MRSGTDGCVGNFVAITEFKTDSVELFIGYRVVTWLPKNRVKPDSRGAILVANSQMRFYRKNGVALAQANSHHASRRKSTKPPLPTDSPDGFSSISKKTTTGSHRERCQSTRPQQYRWRAWRGVLAGRKGRSDDLDAASALDVRQEGKRAGLCSKRRYQTSFVDFLAGARRRPTVKREFRA